MTTQLIFGKAISTPHVSPKPVLCAPGFLTPLPPEDLTSCTIH